MHSIPAVALVSLLVCNVARAADEKDPAKAIEQANAALAAAIEKGDAKAVAEMYTETGRVFPPNSEIVEGRAAIEGFWKASIAGGIAGLELKSLDVEAFGDTIVETGTATVFGKGGTVIDKGKYVVVWKNVGGKWKLHRDCWNSSVAAPKG
jgi:uncharacterized protein (TIGR02246 family)